MRLFQPPLVSSNLFFFACSVSVRTAKDGEGERENTQNGLGSVRSQSHSDDIDQPKKSRARPKAKGRRKTGDERSSQSPSRSPSRGTGAQQTLPMDLHDERTAAVGKQSVPVPVAAVAPFCVDDVAFELEPVRIPLINQLKNEGITDHHVHLLPVASLPMLPLCVYG